MFQGDKLCGKFPKCPTLLLDPKSIAINPALRCRKPWKIRGETACHLSIDRWTGCLSTVWAYCTWQQEIWQSTESGPFRSLIKVYASITSTGKSPLKNTCSYGGFLKWWYPTIMGFPTKNDHFGVFWGYHHLRKHPYVHHLWHFHERRPGPSNNCGTASLSLRMWANLEICAGFQCPTKIWLVVEPTHWKICLSKWDHFPRQGWK